MRGEKEDAAPDCRVCDVFYRVHHTEAGHGEPEVDCGHCDQTRSEYHATHLSMCWDCGLDMSNSPKDLYICKNCKFQRQLFADSANTEFIVY